MLKKYKRDNYVYSRLTENLHPDSLNLQSEKVIFFYFYLLGTYLARS